jgi:hypothetical protein
LVSLAAAVGKPSALLQLGDDADVPTGVAECIATHICLGASRRSHDTCPVRSIAAREVESLVLGQARRLLASPELVARTITAVRRKNGGLKTRRSRSGGHRGPPAQAGVGRAPPSRAGVEPAAADRVDRRCARPHLRHAAGCGDQHPRGGADECAHCCSRGKTAAPCWKLPSNECADPEIETLTIGSRSTCSARGGG